MASIWFMNITKSIFALLLILGLTNVSSAQNLVKVNLTQQEINQIIKAFTEKEREFREALKNYVFNRSVTIQTIGLGGNVTGTYRRDSLMTFTDDGRRFEKVLYAPISTLKDISVTPEDLEDLGGVNPFALEPDVINLYDFTLLGKERIDELDLYVFDVKPKVIPDPKKSKQRLFIGRIWVDDKDLQIVKSKGKGIPETKDNKFPVVETWRENIDGKYWFPTFISSDDELVFDNGFTVKIRMRVRYYNYKQTRTDVRILDDEEQEKPQPTNKQKPDKP